MLKRILIAALAIAYATVAFADVKISAEPSMSALTGTEIFLGNQSGTTKTATAAQFGTYILTVANTVFSFNAGTSYSGASWNTTSPVFNGAAMTLNDTTASGTVATEAAYSLQAANFTSTGGASTTITSAIELYLAAPTCSGGVVCTTPYSLYTAGRAIFNAATSVVGAFTSNSGAINLNNNSNNTVNIGTGSTNALVTIGGGSDGVIINSGLSTGYVKDTGFISVGTKFTLSGGTGSCTTTSTTVGGSAAGSFVCTGTAGAGTVVVTINGASGLTAPNGWACGGSDITSGTAWTQSATSTTTCTLKGTTAANTDVIAFYAMGY